MYSIFLVADFPWLLQLENDVTSIFLWNSPYAKSSGHDEAKSTCGTNYSEMFISLSFPLPRYLSVPPVDCGVVVDTEALAPVSV